MIGLYLASIYVKAVSGCQSLTASWRNLHGGWHQWSHGRNGMSGDQRLFQSTIACNPQCFGTGWLGFLANRHGSRNSFQLIRRGPWSLGW